MTLIKFVPTQTILETELVRLWEQVLQRAPIGIEEDFFDLGGNSIQAARICAGIEEKFHKRLPLSVIFGAATIGKLADSLRPGKSWDRKAYVAPIQASGEKPALFCVGGGAYWTSVSEHIGPDQPVFSIGLEPDATEQVRWPAAIEELARHMVLALCEKQAQGPFYLCGYCQDGIFAYEVARQLVLFGHEVGLLALIEARNPSPEFRVRAVSGFRRAAIRFAFQVDRLRRVLQTGEARQYARARRRELKRFLLRLASLVDQCFRIRARQSCRLDLQEFLYLVATSSKLKPLACPTAIFRCTEWPILSAGDPYFGWRDLLTGSLELHEIPGSHEEIFCEPHVRVLAEKLKNCLQKTRQAAAPAKNERQAAAPAWHAVINCD